MKDPCISRDAQIHRLGTSILNQNFAVRCISLMLIICLVVPTAVLAGVLFWLGYMLEQRASSPAKRRILCLVAFTLALPCVVCDLFYAHLFDTWVWFYGVRAMPLSELSLAGVGLIAGVIYAYIEPETLKEKLVVPIGLIIVLGLPFSKTVMAPLDVAGLHETCETEVCLQSTPSTCGPSSAATILKLYGYGASEKELAKEALTYRGGTENWYLARALRKRGFDADFVVQPSDSLSIPSSSIAGVRLEGGTGHFIAILDTSGESVVIGDPLIGKLKLRRAELSKRYHFTGFFLVVRPRTYQSGS